MKQAIIQLEPLTCPSCIQKVKGAVASFKEIDPATIQVLFNSSKVKFKFDEQMTNLQDVVDNIQQVGYTVQSSKSR